MEAIYRVQDLIRELQDMPPEAPVMMSVVKYPSEMALKTKGEEVSWDESDDVEVLPWEGELYLKNDLVHLVVELTDYSEERREYIK